MEQFYTNHMERPKSANYVFYDEEMADGTMRMVTINMANGQPRVIKPSLVSANGSDGTENISYPELTALLKEKDKLPQGIEEVTEENWTTLIPESIFTKYKNTLRKAGEEPFDVSPDEVKVYKPFEVVQSYVSMTSPSGNSFAMLYAAEGGWRMFYTKGREDHIIPPYNADRLPNLAKKQEKVFKDCDEANCDYWDRKLSQEDLNFFFFQYDAYSEGKTTVDEAATHITAKLMGNFYGTCRLALIMSDVMEQLAKGPVQVDQDLAMGYVDEEVGTEADIFPHREEQANKSQPNREDADIDYDNEEYEEQDTEVKDLYVWKTIDPDMNRKLAMRCMVSMVEVILLVIITVILMIASGGYDSARFGGLFLLLTVLIVIFAIATASKIGKVVNRELQIFFSDRGTGELYEVYASANMRYGGKGIGTLIRYMQYLNDSEKKMDDILMVIRGGLIPSQAVLITKVTDIVEKRKEYIVACVTQTGAKRTYIVSKKYENVDSLIREFQKLKPAGEDNNKEKFKTNTIRIGILAFVCTVICYLSHDRVGVLPSQLYFPFLAFAYVSVVTFIVFIARRGH